MLSHDVIPLGTSRVNSALTSGDIARDGKVVANSIRPHMIRISPWHSQSASIHNLRLERNQVRFEAV